MNPTNYVRDTIDLVKSIETRFLELAERLYRIKEEKLWSSSYESFADFLEAAHISQGHASILTSIHRSYVIEGGKTHNELAGIGYSNLYEAIPLIEKEGIDSAFTKAAVLTRSEIKDEVRDIKHGPHTHTPVDNKRWGMCSCGKFVVVDN